uniref:AsIV-cont00026-ORF1 n=1 Tax=Apophua simplicipes ichnovirus TaxID=1329648 RepID=S5DSY2_9VIRU|nr:AsIV-cont00026-ORF1 [Apophua simplicipes ichnovirus]
MVDYMKRSISAFLGTECSMVLDELYRRDAALRLEYENIVRGTSNFFDSSRFELPELLWTTFFHKTENRSKNRCEDVPCWDLTRVNLSYFGPAASPNTSYIHANYVTNYNFKQKFIATQSPLPETMIDFFNMIWQNNCRIIVVLTEIFENGLYEINPYWRTQLGVRKYEKYRVTTMRIDDQGDYKKYYLKLRNRAVPEEHRIITLYHFTKWPAEGIPSNNIGILAFIATINSEMLNCFRKVPRMGPIVVHGDAGVGRTGTYCAIDICFERWIKTGRVDAFNTVKRLRTERHSSVTTPEQYIFIFRVLKRLVTTKV